MNTPNQPATVTYLWTAGQQNQADLRAALTHFEANAKLLFYMSAAGDPLAKKLIEAHEGAWDMAPSHLAQFIQASQEHRSERDA